MPYIGRGLGPTGAFRILDDVSGSFNGSTTTFALTVASTALTVGLPETLIIAVDGVIQEPGSAYTISGSNIVFGSAPQEAATFWGVELGDVGGIAQDIADGTITFAKLATSVITGAPDLGEAPASGDSLLMSDTSASAALKEITVANLFDTPAITGNATAVTQSVSNNSTRIATTAYVDAQVTAEDLDVTTDSGAIDIDLSSEVFTIVGGEGINTSAAGITLTIVGEDAAAGNKGIAALATVGETNAGTDAAKIITPNVLAGSNYGERVVQLVVVDFAIDVAVATTGKFWFVVPSTLTGMDLVEVSMNVVTAGVTGNTDVMIYNLTDTADMLSAAMRIETTDLSTTQSAQPGTIQTDGRKGVVTNDVLRIDIDTVQTGTAPKGLIVTMIFRMP